MRSTASLLRVEFLGQSPWHDRDYEESALTKVQMKSAGTPAGDGVFILGVPMGRTATKLCIVRQSAIARISEFLEGGSSSFLVDALVFPATAVDLSEMAAVGGISANNKSALIVVIRQYES
jgi:hypothetical protein